MDAATLYMLALCTKALCYPVGTAWDAPCEGFCYRTSLFTMTKAECEAMIERRARKDGRDILFCFTEDEWTRRYPERPDLPVKPIAH
jgi:hypothetical protein